MVSFRTQAPAWMAITFILFGCSKKDSGPPEVPDLKILRPPSGGEMVYIPGGEFIMGDARGRPDETPHPVSLEPFYMDRYPVSQELYKNVLGVNPSKWKGEQNPVERIQWTDAARFCNRCSQLEGLIPCYDPETWECNFEADGYRLPTEAEWEYACRAGSQATYFFGDGGALLHKYAWFKPHSRGRPQPLGKKSPNPWGLYDSLGNIWEWCNDLYSATYYKESPRENPRGPASGKKRVLRGGAWNSTAEKCRAAYRFQEYPVFSDACFGSDSYGFRRVRSARESPGKRASPPVKITQAAARPEKPALPEPPRPPVSKGRMDPARLRGTIIFVSDRGGALDIWMMQASGEHPRQITRDSHPDADPRFSPDGERIICTSLRDGFPEVWMMNRGGTGAKRLTEGCQPEWDPQGKRIVFIRDGMAYVRDLTTGKEKRISPEAWIRCGVPDWSPDGKKIAVASRHLEEIGIFILGLQGEKPEQLKTEVPSCTPQWSGDGKRLVFQTVQGHIHQLDLEGGSEEQVTFGADIQHDARYSPDGSLIVFSRAPSPEGPWQICIADLESEDLDYVQITREGSNSLPDWHSIQE